MVFFHTILMYSNTSFSAPPNEEPINENPVIEELVDENPVVEGLIGENPNNEELNEETNNDPVQLEVGDSIQASIQNSHFGKLRQRLKRILQMSIFYCYNLS